MPVGHPVGASNAIFHRSRPNRPNVLSLSLRLLSRRAYESRKGGGRWKEVEEERGRSVKFDFTVSSRAATMGATDTDLLTPT